MTREELLALPPTIDVEIAARALGIGRALAYDLVKREEFPVRVLHLGRRFKIITAELHSLLGVHLTLDVTDGAPSDQELGAAETHALTRQDPREPEYKPAA